jgi:hypothetical protein
MSGFEVIGEVLAVWPVVVNALSLYKATKDGRAYGLLLNELRTEEQVYSEFVRLLLQADVPEADLVQLTDSKRPNLGLWKDRALHFSIERRLGQEKSKLVTETLLEMDKLLVSLSEKLGGSEDVSSLLSFTLSETYFSYTYQLFLVRKLKLPDRRGRFELTFAK